METLKFIIKKLGLLLLNCGVLLLTFFIPKSDRIIIVGGWFGKRFADNSKYFFLYAFNNMNKLNIDKIVWITRDEEVLKELKEMGFLVFKAWSLMGIWYHLRAKYHVIDQTLSDINPFFSVRAKRINLWHGFPLKRIGIYVKDYGPRKPQYKTLLWYMNKITFRGCWFDYYLLATSKFTAKVLGEAFEINEERINISGYPRNYEPIIDKPIKYVQSYEKNSYEKVEKYISEGYKIIGYFPTFRDKRDTLIFGTDNLNEISQFMDFCEEHKIKILGKFHFAGNDDKLWDVVKHESFINLPSKADVYTFLNQIDILITDYSSIYFDFLLWNRPIIFFPYDLEYYRDEDRGLIFDYDDFTPGPKAHNISELKSILSKNLDIIKDQYEKEFKDSAENLKKKIWGDYNKMDIKHLFNQMTNEGLKEEI